MLEKYDHLKCRVKLSILPADYDKNLLHYAFTTYK